MHEERDEKKKSICGCFGGIGIGVGISLRFKQKKWKSGGHEGEWHTYVNREIDPCGDLPCDLNREEE